MDYRKRLKDHKRIIIKIGTSTVAYPNGRINLKRMEQLAWVLADLKNQGKEIVLVSSGAMGVGAAALGLKERPKEIRLKQATAAVGQASLIHIYKNFFNEYNQVVAQVLLTKEDVNEEGRKQVIINSFETLIGMDIVPIVNNNDAVTTFEFEFSDNDSLSAVLANIIGADLLIILSDIDSLYDSNPKEHPDAKRVSVVEVVTEEIEKMAEGKGSEFSVGGMATKIDAAKICRDSKTDMVVTNGSDPKVIYKILDGEDIGTLFLGK